MSILHDVLLKSNVFEDFTAEEIDMLRQYLSVERFVNGQVLMKKGEAGTYLGIILSGKVDIIDENIVITTRSEGDLLGEIALIRSSTHIADVVAVSDGKIAVMQFDAITRFKLEHPKIALRLMSFLAELTMKKLGETEEALQAEKQESKRLLLNIRFDKGYFRDIPFVAESPTMKNILNQVRLVSATPVNVIIQGENGTGKELIARMIHEESNRHNQSFVGVNCASIPETLVESEFFGYEKGAFTGAHTSRGGYFEEASGGTLFLDEIADMPISIQPKFLRAIQEGEGYRLGSKRLVTYDVRIISATNKNLKQEVEAGRFREDLFFRLFSVEISVSSLRERKEDIAPMAFVFLEDVCKRFEKKVAGFSSDVIRLFEEYHWPGNVRQLRREVERMVVLTPSGEQITLDKCSGDLLRSVISTATEEPLGLLHIPLPSQIKSLEIRLIRKALKETNGNRTHAAKLLGITRQGLQKKIRRYEI
jgi:transcriptional regulator with PAS, ATPase and Fis domain